MESNSELYFFGEPWINDTALVSGELTNCFWPDFLLRWKLLCKGKSDRPFFLSINAVYACLPCSFTHLSSEKRDSILFIAWQLTVIIFSYLLLLIDSRQIMYSRPACMGVGHSSIFSSFILFFVICQELMERTRKRLWTTLFNKCIIGEFPVEGKACQVPLCLSTSWWQLQLWPWPKFCTDSAV